MYGATSADFTITSGGRVIPGAVLTLWTARTGGTQITDLLDVDSVATTTVTSAADGSVVYYGPDGDNELHWADSGQGNRIAIRPTVTDIMDYSIQDEDIAADADIGRSKIAGTALTSESMGVFSVLDYGAVGDYVADDTDAIQAALDAGAGATVFVPPGKYRIDGSLTVPERTKITGNLGNPGTGWQPPTSLEFTTAENDYVALTLGQYVTISDLIFTGSYEFDYTTTCMSGQIGVLDNITVRGFYTGVTATAYYMVLNKVEFNRNAIALDLVGCYNVNLYGCQFQNQAESGGYDDSISIQADVVRSLNVYGGAIEGYQRGIVVTGSGGVHLFGVYFEPSKVALDEVRSTAVELDGAGGVNLLMTGCTIYLNNHEQFVNVGSGTKVAITSSGNLWRTGDAYANTPVAFALSTSNTCRYNLSGDHWADAYGPGATYVGTYLDGGTVANANITFPAGYDASALAPEPTAFHGHNLIVPALSIGTAEELTGSGDPDGVVAAPVGSTFRRTDGGAGTSFYVKESGTDTSSGWVAKGGTGPTEFDVGTVSTGSADVSISGDEVAGYTLDFVLPFAGEGNLVTANQASLETDTTGWTAGGGTPPTISQSTEQYLDGAASLKAVSNLAGTMTVSMTAGVSNYADVIAGQYYTAVASLYVTSVTRTAEIKITWYTSGAASISTVAAASAASCTAGEWTEVRVGGVAPATAAYGRVFLYVYGTTVSQEFYWDQIGVWRGVGGLWALPGAEITGLSPVLVSPDSTQYALTVANGGTLSTTAL